MENYAAKLQVNQSNFNMYIFINRKWHVVRAGFDPKAYKWPQYFNIMVRRILIYSTTLQTRDMMSWSF